MFRDRRLRSVGQCGSGGNFKERCSHNVKFCVCYHRLTYDSSLLLILILLYLPLSPE